MAEPMTDGWIECGNCGGDIAHDSLLGQWVHARDNEARCRPYAADSPFADPCADGPSVELERLRERLKLAEDVCLMFGWSPAVDQASDRAKATTMLWRRWHDHVGNLTDPKNHPHLNDDKVSELARERDEIRDRTLAKLRSERSPS